MSIFAAAGVAAVLWIATPAMAADEVVPPVKQAAGITSVKVASAPSKRHHIWPRYRVASWYTARMRYADAMPFSWHSYFGPRPTLLMVGVAY